MKRILVACGAVLVLLLGVRLWQNGRALERGQEISELPIPGSAKVLYADRWGYFPPRFNAADLIILELSPEGQAGVKQFEPWQFDGESLYRTWTRGETTPIQVTINPNTRIVMVSRLTG